MGLLYECATMDVQKGSQIFIYIILSLLKEKKKTLKQYRSVGAVWVFVQRASITRMDVRFAAA